MRTLVATHDNPWPALMRLAVADRIPTAVDRDVHALVQPFHSTGTPEIDVSDPQTPEFFLACRRRSQGPSSSYHMVRFFFVRCAGS